MTEKIDRAQTGAQQFGEDDAAVAPALLDMSDPHFMAASRALYDDLRDDCPVARVTFRGNPDEPDGTAQDPFGQGAYLITRYLDANAALLDDRFSVDPQIAMTAEQFAQMPEVPEEFRPLRRNLLGVDPPDHTRLRKLVQPSFTGRAIDALRLRIQALADELLDDAERVSSERGETAPNRTMELVDAFAYPLPIRVICEMLGIPREDQADIRRWSESLLSGGVGRGQEQVEEARVNLAALADYLRRSFAEKRGHPGEDLTSQLVNAEEDGDRLDEDELLAMVFILLLAGHVTTVNLIASGVFALLTHPDQLSRLKADPALAPAAVEEVLRYWGPLETTLPRFTKEDVEVVGTIIPRGETVLVGLASANHDPARFANPHAFEIGREDANRQVAFGKGIHVCLGAPLARLEGRVVFETLFRRFPDIRLAVPAAEVAWRPSFLRGLKELPLLF